MLLLRYAVMLLAYVVLPLSLCEGSVRVGGLSLCGVLSVPAPVPLSVAGCVGTRYVMLCCDVAVLSVPSYVFLCPSVWGGPFLCGGYVSVRVSLCGGVSLCPSVSFSVPLCGSLFLYPSVSVGVSLCGTVSYVYGAERPVAS